MRRAQRVTAIWPLSSPTRPHLSFSSRPPISLPAPLPSPSNSPPLPSGFPLSAAAAAVASGKAKRRLHERVLMAADSSVSLSDGEAGPMEDEEKEEVDAEVRQLPEHELQDKILRTEDLIKNGGAYRLPDGGKKLRAKLAAIRRELARREPLSEAPHPHGGGPEGVRIKDEKGCKRVARSRDAESSGVDMSSLEVTSRSPGKPNASVKNEEKFCQDKKSCKSSIQPMNSSQEELYLDNSANMEKISSDDSPKYIGHHEICTPALTACKRKRDTSLGFSMRLRSRKEKVFLLEGDAAHPEPAEETSNKRSAGKLYYPTREHPNSVEISPSDIKCLEPEAMLSSPIMNFYITYLQRPTSSTVKPSGQYHIFNTYFFCKLEAITSKEDIATYFPKLRRWWKDVEIFQKAYILLPVHAKLHWSLVIICMPAKDDQTGPIILHLDSLKIHNSRLIFTVVSRFLTEEWRYLNEKVSFTKFPLRETVWKNLPRKIKKKKIEVPQQENNCDCGLFVLYYMQRFIQEAPERLHKKDLSMFGKRWFGPEEPSQLRPKIRRLILSCGEAGPMNGPTEPTCGEAQPMK